VPSDVHSPTCRPDLASFGFDLYRSAFPAEVRERFQGFVAGREEGQGVRVCICADAHELNEAAWEALCDQLWPAANFLALDPRTPVVRGPRITREVLYAREINYPLRALVVLALPRLVQKIDAQAEKRALETAFAAATLVGRVEVDYLGFDNPTAVNFDALQQRLAAQDPPFDVVHIIGHGLLESGREGEIALVSPTSGKAQIVTASSLANLFRARGVMLVVLQACQSGAEDASAQTSTSLALQLVAAGVPAVLAMRENVDQDLASYFAHRLYSGWVMSGYSFEDALTRARQSVYQEFPDRITGWITPVLYLCPGVPLVLRDQTEGVETGDRLVDAGLPAQTRVGKETELVVVIRPPGGWGLRDMMGANPEDYECSPKDVRTSDRFTVSFPTDRQGRALPGDIQVRVDTRDFQLPDGHEKRVQIRPTGESSIIWFGLIPKTEGRARLYVRILDLSPEPITLAELHLRSQVSIGEAFQTNYEVAGTMARILTEATPSFPAQALTPHEEEPSAQARGKQCIKCGRTELPDSARFCSVCGQELPGSRRADVTVSQHAEAYSVRDVHGHGYVDYVVSTLSDLDAIDDATRQKLKDLYKAQSQSARATTRFHLALGLTQLDLGQYSEAIASLSKAHERAPLDADTLYYLALAHIRGRELRTLTWSEIGIIERLLDAAIRLDASRAHYLYLLALVKYEYYLRNGLTASSPQIEDLLSNADQAEYSRSEIAHLFRHAPVAESPLTQAIRARR
jgi:tetratricopeptide (TPR) repeat protein